MRRPILTARRSGHFSTTLVILAAWAATATGAEPPIGAIQTRQVISVSLHVGSTEQDSRRVVYSPPPGWHIRSHQVNCANRYGLVSYVVNTIPEQWHWSSNEGAGNANQMATFAAALTPEGLPLQTGVSYQQERSYLEHSRRVASHHALVVEATAKGAGLFRGGSGVELTVIAELVFLGR